MLEYVERATWNDRFSYPFSGRFAEKWKQVYAYSSGKTPRETIVKYIVYSSKFTTFVAINIS
jgi:hypothetical protein